jgi:RNA polymerase sigma factor (sigma-70 family)
MHEPDDVIISRILAGEERGYALLLRRYRDRVMTLALRMLGTTDDAEEAAQDAFIRAFRSLHGFEHRARFSTWLYRITYNVCVSRLSRRRHEERSLDADDGFDPVDEDAAGDADVEMEELRQALADAIARLRPEYAGVITLFYMHEQSHEEITAITGLPLGTVKNRLHRARQELRQILRTQLRDVPH